MLVVSETNHFDRTGTVIGRHQIQEGVVLKLTKKKDCIEEKEALKKKLLRTGQVVLCEALQDHHGRQATRKKKVFTNGDL